MAEPALFDLQAVTFGYDGQTVIRNLTIQLPGGRFYGLVGPNGCGKTTLLDLLTGSLQPAEGQIFYRGTPLADHPRRQLAREIALVPQEFDPGFGFTVEDLVLMGRHPHIGRFASASKDDWHHVDAALEQIGIGHLRHRHTTQLSGGQKQRAVVARALAQNTPILLFDEATSNLDIKYTLQILDTARSLSRTDGKTVIAVMHDLNLAAAYCDELLFMDTGKIVTRGVTEVVFTPTTISAVFGVECQVFSDHYDGRPRVSFRTGRQI